MRAIVGAERADDYVLATGETHSVGEFCELAFHEAGLDYRNHVVRETIGEPVESPQGETTPVAPVYTHVAITDLKQVHTAAHPAALLLPRAGTAGQER